MPANYQHAEYQRDRRGFQGQQQASFSSQLPRRPRPVPRAPSRSPPVSSRAQPRPRAARPGTRTPTSALSRGRARAEYAQRAARSLFDFALARYMEQQHRRTGESSRAHVNATATATATATANESTSHPHPHLGQAGSAVGHAVTGVLLEQLIQEMIEYLVRHNFFRPRRTPSASRGQTGHSRQVDTGTQTSQSSTEQMRRRLRRRRHSEVLMTSLDRLSSELETTYDSLMSVLREPAPAIDESLRENANNLRQAITRCMARVESVQTRSRRSRRARGNARLSRESTGRSG